jgi:translation initiation factor 2 subunit 2
MNVDYEKALERAYAALPKKTEASERFEIPTADIVVQGNKTIIKNFESIANKLRREQKHLAKYLSKELAAPSNIEGGRLILNSKLSERSINEKIKNYVEIFVICKQCKRPDTKLIEYERGIYTMSCEACGARNPVPKI